MKSKKRVERITWGESADVMRLPTEREDGSEVVRVERRKGGQQHDSSHQAAVVRFHQMRLANILFPEHVIELTDFQSKREVWGEMQPRPPRFFSRYYPLPTESRQEMLATRELIRRAHSGLEDDESVKRAVSAHDLRMRERYPELTPTAKKLEAAGFKVPHPEMNFTIHNGKVVFYEAYFQGRQKTQEFSQINSSDMDLIEKEMLRQMGEKTREDARKLFIGVFKTLCQFFGRFRGDERMLGDHNRVLVSNLEAAHGGKYITHDEEKRLFNVVSHLEGAKTLEREGLYRHIRL